MISDLLFHSVIIAAIAVSIGALIFGVVAEVVLRRKIK